jgi:hypothetical protein
MTHSSSLPPTLLMILPQPQKKDACVKQQPSIFDTTSSSSMKLAIFNTQTMQQMSSTASLMVDAIKNDQ